MMRTLLFFLFFSTGLLAQTVYTIEEARAIDTEGIIIHDGENVELTGIAIGPNFRGGGLTFALYEAASNLGITVFLFNTNLDYMVTDGDELKIIGELTQFNGLAEIEPTEITIVSQGNAIPSPTVVTALNEMTESNLVTLSDVMLVDPTQWGFTGDFNVDVTDGTNTMTLRIDGDSGITGMGAPEGTFSVTGIGGQFDNETPYLDGYQLFPRSASDITPYNTTGGGPTYTEITLEQARENDANGLPVLEGELVQISGVTHGINFRPGGSQFTIINENNVGVGVFSGGGIGYEFQEGDELQLWGVLTNFNGLTQLSPDSFFVASTDNALVTPREVTTLDESTESSLVRIEFESWDMNWPGDGSSFNAEMIGTNGEAFVVRVDNDTELANMGIEIMENAFAIIGVGGQFDSSDPRDSGYQLFPRFSTDIVIGLSSEDLYQGHVAMFPNPTSSILTIESDDQCDGIEIFNLQGQLMRSNRNEHSMDISDMTNGLYYVRLNFGDKYVNKKLIKM